MILDPFCGCATTLVAAERLNRHWVGIDIWDNAKEVILERLQREGLVRFGQNRKSLLDEFVHFTDKPPTRTDNGEISAPFLRVRNRIMEPDGKRWARQQMYDHLLEQFGCKCQGCDRIFEDCRYLELDHNIPRSDGGINHVTNRILLRSLQQIEKQHLYPFRIEEGKQEKRIHEMTNNKRPEQTTKTTQQPIPWNG